ncbi:hypothetical protein Zmor_016555 [Zophobas morio]|uniref:Transposable element P transposase-like GTP-binding insertion domain-containing protein n=1 Tax=Zophobas morio TaxID=2755281 RepID=A0AA38I9V4_9CUCU|nr:hypothetical protein Zmor_016555 [Zophobas morio]
MKKAVAVQVEVKARTQKVVLTVGKVITWRYIKKLHELQNEQFLNVANKLKKAHLEWRQHKIKHKLLARVADALEFLKDLGIGDFQGCEATIEFIRRIDSLFDILNSRSVRAKNFKAPLRENNEEMWRPFLIDTNDYLLNLKDVTGRPLWCTPRKTSILGFVISATSFMGIFDEFVSSKRLNDLLTYKCSQDHLEIVFCSVREVAENVAYIGSYVVKMVVKTLKCADCISSCIETRGSDLQFYRLLDKRNMGGLIKPFAGVVKICCYCELQIRKILQLTDNKLPNDEQFFKTFGMPAFFFLSMKAIYIFLLNK